MFATTEKHIVTVPPALGTVAEEYRSLESDKFVIYIQDVHCNYSVQNTISEILAFLRMSYPDFFIGIEGASGTLNPAVYRSLPDTAVREKVCREFMKKGFLTGVEKYAIADDSATGVFLAGLEHFPLFIENLRQFRAVIMAADNAEEILSALNKMVTDAENAVYPVRLKEFQRKACAWQEGGLSITEWIDYLAENARLCGVPLSEYPELSAIAHLSQDASVYDDTADLGKEREKLLADLKSRLDAHSYKEAMKFVLEFETGRLTAVGFLNAMGRFGIAWDTDYPASGRFIQRCIKKEQIGTTGVFSELEALESALRTHLIEQTVSGTDGSDANFRRQMCRQLNGLRIQVDQYKKLLSLRMNDSELSRYFQERHSNEPQDVIAALNRIYKYYAVPIDEQAASACAEQLVALLERARLFYTTADRRSTVMVENLLEQMNTSGRRIAVVVAGGFHARIIQETLRARRISFATIIPAVENGGADIYLPLMMQSALNELYMPNAAASYIPFPVLLGLMTADAPYFKQLRTNLARDLLTSGGISIADYRRRITSDIQKALFEKLVMLAQVELNQSDSLPVNTVLSELSPVAVVQYMRGFTDRRIEQELYGAGYMEDTVTAEARQVFGEYLLELLSLAVQVGSDEFDEPFYLNALLSTVQDSSHTAVQSAVRKKLETLSLEVKPAPAEFVQSYDEATMRKLAEDILRKAGARYPDAGIDSTVLPDMRIEHIENTAAILRTGQRYPQVSLSVSLPNPDGSRTVYRVRGGTPGYSQQTGVAAFSVLHLLNPRYYEVEHELGLFTHFYLTESTNEQNIIDSGFGAENASFFAAEIGKAAAQANFFGMTGRALDDLRVSSVPGGITKVVFADYYDMLSLREQKPLELLMPMIDFLAVARRSGADDAEQRNLIHAFLQGFKSESQYIQDIFSDNEIDFRRVPGLAGMPGWNAVMNRLDETVNNPKSYLDEFITYFNDAYGFGFYDTDELRMLALNVLNNVKQNTEIDISDELQPEDIKIVHPSRAGLIAEGDYDEQRERLIFAVEVPDRNGNEKKYYIKSALPHDGDVIGIEALKMLGRTSYFYAFSPIEIGTFAGFHVIEDIGSYPLYHFTAGEEHAHKIAQLVGEAAAEAYMIGIYDRNNINARVILDDAGTPYKVVNIDLETALMPGHEDMDTLLIATIFLEDASKRGVPTEQLYAWGVAFLESFYTTLNDMQEYAAVHRLELENNQVLKNNPFWKNALIRLDSEQTDILDVVLGASDLIAREVVASLAHRVLNKLHENVQIALSDELRASELSVRLIQVDSLFMQWQGGVLEEQAEFVVSVPLNGEERATYSFYGIKDDKGFQENKIFVGDGYTAYYVRLPIGGFAGFYVREHVSEPETAVSTADDELHEFSDEQYAFSGELPTGGGILVAEMPQTEVRQATITEIAVIYQFLSEIGLERHAVLADTVQGLLLEFSAKPVRLDSTVPEINGTAESLFYASYQEQLQVPLFKMIRALPGWRMPIVNLVPFLTAVQNAVIEYVSQLPVTAVEPPLADAVRAQRAVEQSL
ncbi:MAG: hypothetical protein H7A34_08005 [bacterium]|nr:hypothetical protein [bacterium]